MLLICTSRRITEALGKLAPNRPKAPTAAVRCIPKSAAWMGNAVRLKNAADDRVLIDAIVVFSRKHVVKPLSARFFGLPGTLVYARGHRDSSMLICVI